MPTRPRQKQNRKTSKRPSQRPRRSSAKSQGRRASNAELQQYKCDKCGATFTDPEMLEKHSKVHIEGGGGDTAQADVAVGIPATEPQDNHGEPLRPSPNPEPSPSPLA